MVYFELFYTFFLIGVMTFGGGYAMIPFIQEMVVGKWGIESSHVTDFIAISELTPGTFAINMATFVGTQAGGIAGAACATIGVILPSFIIILLIAWVLSKIMKNRFVRAGLDGIKPIVLSLISSTAIVYLVKAIFYQHQDLYTTFNFDLRILALIIITFSFVFIYKKVRKKSFNPLLILALTGLLGLIIFI